jgi:hypothetical protein
MNKETKLKAEIFDHLMFLQQMPYKGHFKLKLENQELTIFYEDLHTHIKLDNNLETVNKDLKAIIRELDEIYSKKVKKVITENCNNSELEILLKKEESFVRMQKKKWNEYDQKIIIYKS